MGAVDGGRGALPSSSHRPRRAARGNAARLLAIGLGALAAVGLALVSQHVYDMQPCPWCVLQRLVFLVIGGVALVGSAWPRPAGRLAGVIVVLLALGGMASALWQHFKAAASASCSLTLADRLISGLGLDRLLPDVFEPRASCAEAAVKLLGVPYDFWSLALFVVAATLGWTVLRRPEDGQARLFGAR